VTQSKTRMRLPDDPSLPFFAYGLFKPGELAYPLIRKFVERKTEGEIPKAHFVRDGLALLHREMTGSTTGSALHFKTDACRSAYEEIAAFEPWTQYAWGTGKVEMNDGTVLVNVLFGKSPESGSDHGSSDHGDAMNRPWSGRHDPLFFTGLEVVQETLKNAGEFNLDMKPTLRIQSAYLLLFSIIERFASHSCSLRRQDPVDKLKTLAKNPEFASALKAVVTKEDADSRKVRRSWDGAHNNVNLDPEDPVKSMDYYYQVRCTATHAGKSGLRDHEILRTCTRELIDIFTRVRDDMFAKSADDD
jgi:hypothetical protein